MEKKKSHFYSFSEGATFIRNANHLQEETMMFLLLDLPLTCRCNHFPWTHRWNCSNMVMDYTGCSASCTLWPHYHLHRHIQSPAWEKQYNLDHLQAWDRTLTLHKRYIRFPSVGTWNIINKRANHRSDKNGPSLSHSYICYRLLHFH